MRRNALPFTAVSLLWFLLIADIHAEPVTFEISATVYNISDPGNAFQNSVNLGDKITGTYTIDVATPDSDPDPQYGHYIFNNSSTTPQFGFDFLLNNNSLKSDPTVTTHMFEALIANSVSDHFGIISWENMPLSNGSSVDNIAIDMYDSTGQALTSDALTALAPNVSAFEWHDIHVGGNAFSGTYYNLDAKIDSIHVVGNQCPPASANIVTFNVKATVRDIYDYNNVLGNTVKVGDTISGSYTFNTSTPDIDSAPEYGRYEHFPGSGTYGFNIEIANTSLKTNTTSDTFNVMIADNAGSVGGDIYALDNYGSQQPFVNNSVVNILGIYIDDPSGNAVTGVNLSNQPPALTGTGNKDFIISGMSTTAATTNYFTIVANLDSISACQEPQDPIVVSPASGVFDVMQHFDAAIVMEAGLPPLTQMRGTMNGMDITPALSGCFPGAPNSQNRQTFICPGFSNLMMPGNNSLVITFSLANGRVLSHTVDWQLLGN